MLFSLKVAFLLTVFVVWTTEGKDHSVCYTRHAKKWQTTGTFIEIYGQQRCRALCYDRNQLAGTCFGYSTQYEAWYIDKRPDCYVSEGKVVESSMKEYAHWYTDALIDGICERDGCWSVSTSKVSPLTAVDAVDKNHCRFICLETPGCLFQSFTGTKCSIQLPGGKSAKKPITGTNYKLKAECKAESCWQRHRESDIVFDQLLPTKALNEFDCRQKCLENWECGVFKWKNNIRECFTQHKQGVIPIKETPLAGTTYYLLKNECYWN